MVPQPRRWSRATLPKRPLSRQETEVTEVDRQLRTTASAVAIRARSISYCEPFAIANSLRFRRDQGPILEVVSKKSKRKAAARARAAGAVQNRGGGPPAKATRPNRASSPRLGILLGVLAGVLVVGALIVFVGNLPKAGSL